MPLFSIIIPTSDRWQMLIQCLQSCINQESSNWEALVVDNGRSNREIRYLIDEFNDNRIKLIESEVKYDRSIARNTGYQMSSGAYICFVDDDDHLHPEYISRFEDWYNHHPDRKETILRCGYLIDRGDKTLKSVIYNKKIHKNPATFAAFNMCGVWTLSIPRQYLKDNSFPEGFPHWQDTHLILQLLCQYPFEQLAFYNYTYRIHEGMGSQEIKYDESPENRLQLHLAAVEDFFSKYPHLYRTQLPENTKNVIYAEKYLQYATASSIYFDGKNSWNWFVKSLRSAFLPRLWKSYIVFFRFHIPKLLRLR